MTNKEVLSFKETCKLGAWTAFFLVFGHLLWYYALTYAKVIFMAVFETVSQIG